MFDYKKALIILPERLGDALFHTPAIHLLKKMRPQTSIDVLALSPLCASLLENNPSVRHVYVAPSQADTAHLARDHDVVLNLHDHTASRRYVEWLGLPTLTSVPTDGRHRALRSLEFMQNLLGCETTPAERRYLLYPAAANQQKIDALLARYGVQPDDLLVGCHIGCHSMAKRRWQFWKPLTHPKVWPLEHFVELASSLRQQDSRIRFVLTGSDAEARLGRQFARKVPSAINLIDATSVLDLAALMNRLALFLCSDTGTLHVACASGIGIVALFGPTALQLTGPYPMQDNYTVLRTDNIADISVAQVREAILSHPALASTRVVEQAVVAELTTLR